MHVRDGPAKQLHTRLNRGNAWHMKTVLNGKQDTLMHVCRQYPFVASELGTSRPSSTLHFATKAPQVLKIGNRGLTNNYNHKTPYKHKGKASM